MNKLFKLSLLVAAISFWAACSNSETKNQSTGDSGDSASIGTGTDTTGVMVDTGSALTDTTENE